MDKVGYYVATAAESVLSVVGIRATYEQPRYRVVEQLDRGVEIREYKPRVAVETDTRGQGDNDAFGRLFRYITGANRSGDLIAMTTPVEASGRRIAMTVPVEQGAGGSMRFFLPEKVAEGGPPEPTDAAVRVVRLPMERMAVLRFSGSVTPEARAEQERVLLTVLDAAGRTPKGPLVFMGYDPPFAIPFLRRNEVAARL